MTSPDPAKLSLNTATVKKQWKLGEIIDGCARHGIRGISPWRDQVAEMGLSKAASSMARRLSSSQFSVVKNPPRHNPVTVN